MKNSFNVQQEELVDRQLLLAAGKWEIVNGTLEPYSTGSMHYVACHKQQAEK